MGQDDKISKQQFGDDIWDISAGYVSVHNGKHSVEDADLMDVVPSEAHAHQWMKENGIDPSQAVDYDPHSDHMTGFQKGLTKVVLGEHDGEGYPEAVLFGRRPPRQMQLDHHVAPGQPPYTG